MTPPKVPRLVATAGSVHRGLSVFVEACVTSLDEARKSVRDGASRLELCVDLEVDGLSPSPGLLRGVVGAVGGTVPVLTMVRRVPGPFVCTPADRSAVVDAVRRSVEYGAAGIVAGFLNSDQTRPDLDLMAEIVGAAGPLGVTFHKAFDHVADPRRAAGELRDVGVARILTAGGPGRAVEHLGPLRELVALQQAGEAPAIIAAGGIRGPNVRKIVEATGVEAVHARASAIPEVVSALRAGDG